MSLATWHWFFKKKVGDPKALKYLNCLSKMNENWEAESEAPAFLEYTKLWIDKINRGSLFQVNNDVFLLFRAMETAVRRVLTISQILLFQSKRTQKV